MRNIQKHYSLVICCFPSVAKEKREMIFECFDKFVFQLKGGEWSEWNVPVSAGVSKKVKPSEESGWKEVCVCEKYNLGFLFFFIHCRKFALC